MALSAGSKKANSDLARGIAGTVTPEDVEPGWLPIGSMALRMRSGWSEANRDRSAADPYFVDNEGYGADEPSASGMERDAFQRKDT